MSDRYSQLASLLFEVEKELRDMQLWAEQSPPAESLLSTQPFSVDVLTFTEWLQFIFLPKMYAAIETAADLPESCSIAPMAEEFFKATQTTGKTAGQVDTRSIIRRLAAVDRFICGR